MTTISPRFTHFFVSFLWMIVLELIITNSTFSQWVQILQPIDQTSTDYTYRLAISDTSVFAGTGLNGVLRTSDNGASWMKVLFHHDVSSLAVSGKRIFAGIWGIGVFVSTDDGATWKPINNGLSNTYVSSLAVSGTALYAGTRAGVFLFEETDGNWIAKNIGLSGTIVSSLAFKHTALYAGTQGDGIYSSRNFGETWTHYSVGYITTLFHTFAFSGPNIIAGTWDDGVFLSSNCGQSWSASNSGLISKTILSFSVYGTNVFAGTGNHGVFLSTDHGISWNQVSSGLPMNIFPSVFSLAILGPNIFAGTWGPGVWRRSLSEMVTSAEQDSSVEQDCEILPSHYSLRQNYPNPFNPSTKISFSLPSKSFVNLKVYDLLGGEVYSILSTELSAGDHVFQWDALTLPGGIYFCRLQVEAYTSTIKMILLK